MTDPASMVMRKRNLTKVQVAQTNGTQPFSRVKSSSAVTQNGKMFLFGGFDENDKLDGNVYTLDVSTLTWETHKHHTYREGHSALGIGGDDILVYGGISDDNGIPNASHAHDPLMVYNLAKHQWRAAPVVGQVPEHRSRHAACLSADGTKMFVSGGQLQEEANPLDDLYCYDIATGEWDGPRKFICRFDHSIIFYDDKIWAFGGLTNEMAHATEISYFDLITNTTGTISMNDLPKHEGDHIYVPSKNESLLLDVVVPLWTFEKVEPSIGLYDLKSLRWQAVLTGSFRPLMGYRWRHTFVFNGKLYLIGYPLNNQMNDHSFDYKLSEVVELDLGDLGVSETTPHHGAEGGVVSDLSKLMFQEEFSDFKIIGIEGDERPSSNSKFVEHTPLGEPFGALDSDTFVKSRPIPVHSLILLARWPHFQRIVSSGMEETRTNTLFIPEPVEWLAGLVEYLYTDGISNKDINTLTGLLILSNIYDLPRLRSLCIQSIYSQGFKIKNVLKIWSRARLVGEQVMMHNAATFCFFNWGKVVKTKSFRDLPKEELVALCQEVEQDSVIVNNRGVVHGVHENLQTQQAQQGFTLNSPYRSTGSALFRIGGAKETDEDEDEEDEDSEGTVNEDIVNVGSRFSTPQASIYMGNPQMGMNSLGERQDLDDTDMEEGLQ